MYRYKRVFLGILAVLVIIFGAITSVISYKKDQIVEDLVQKLNAGFVGMISLKDVQISPFANFPYISIDLKEVKVFEDKKVGKAPILDLKDLFVGFDLWTILSGKYDIKLIKLKDGYGHIIQDINGDFNIVKALESNKESTVSSEALHLELRQIEIVNFEIDKLNEQNNVLIDVKISKAKSKLALSEEQKSFTLDSKFLLTVVQDGDTTVIKNKNFDVDTKLNYTEASQVLNFEPSEIYLEDALFKMKGNIDFDDDMNLDLKFEGAKPNFDLFIAFAPAELIPVLKKYDNKERFILIARLKANQSMVLIPKLMQILVVQRRIFPIKSTIKS